MPLAFPPWRIPKPWREESALDTRKILLVGDIPAVEPELRSLPGHNYEIHRASCGVDALSLLRSSRFDVVVGDAVTSTAMAPLLDSLEKVERRPVIISSAPHGGSATREGTVAIHEQLDAPLTTTKILHSIQRAIEYADLVRENQKLTAYVRENDGMELLVGNSKGMELVRERLRIVAGSNTAVLISGETGSGKELAAREIYRLGGGRGEFVKLDCAAAPEALLEEQLLGNDAGPGLLQRAGGGTLLLDDVDRLPLHAQSRLVHILDGSEGDRPLQASTRPPRGLRIISTTRHDIGAEVAAGRFRADLYYCLGVVPVRMPSLRERREDIPQLIAYFVERFSRGRHAGAVSLLPAAVEKLRNARWRGNVRELRNVLERAILLAPTPTLDAADLHFDDERDERSSRVEETFRFGSVREMERLMILNRLRENDDNRTRAAKTLEISVRTLRNKLRDYRQTGDI